CAIQLAKTPPEREAQKRKNPPTKIGGFVSSLNPPKISAGFSLSDGLNHAACFGRLFMSMTKR
ncbi:hypothetical protein, partial [Rhizobium skierniewicense]|uniref:hypothetical protein n=1 Tax=Rhizobium skierniewicense TaxID=984260 RepID=UPI001AEEED4F